jgi:thymidine kinase
MRVINDVPVFDGEQVAIDGDDVSYRSVCARCYLKTQKESA